MRAVFVLLLAVVALSFFAPTASAQRGNFSFVNFFNDSACTHHIRTEVIPLPSSTKCVPEHFRHHNESTIFQCTTANNQTAMSLSFYNGTASCDNTALLTYTSTAPARSCAEIDITVEGQAFTAYGHVRCEDEMSMGESVEAARAGVPETPLAKVAKKLRMGKLFQ